MNRPIGCVFHGMVADDLPHPQQQLPLPTNDPEAQPGGGWAWPDLSLAVEVQIQQMTPTILPSQPPSPTPVLNPGGPDEANHAASAPMDSQGSISRVHDLGKFHRICSSVYLSLQFLTFCI
jgi:hypothetical protein